MRINILAFMMIVSQVIYSQQKDSLMMEFQKECDDFEGHCFYFHRNARWEKGFYPYIVEKNNTYTLQFHISYIAENWLFVKSVKAKINDNVFNVVENLEFDRTILNKGICENIDFVADQTLISSLDKIRKNDIIKLRFSNAENYDDVYLHQYQSDPIEKTMNLYHLLTPSK